MASFRVDSSKSDFSIYRNLLLIASVAVGIGAQLLLSTGAILAAVVAYTAACLCAIIGVLPAGSGHTDVPYQTRQQPRTRSIALAISAVVFGAGTFAASGGNLYRIESVAMWAASMVCWWLAWMNHPDNSKSLAGSPGQEIKQPKPAIRLAFRLHAPVIVLIVILGIGLAFRYADLYNNPREMNSDQAEKLLDINDVLNGTPHIFFERNTGRESWQFYWTVMLIKLFQIRPDYMALKLGTSLIGWLMLPAIFLLAREVFNTRTALIATLFAAVASWGVITARYGLRYPLAPCAVAWTMYFLIRGLKRNERNSMLAAGVWVGIGLQGYTAYRFMVVVAPLVVLLWMICTWQRRQSTLVRTSFMNGLLAFIMALLVMMPLLRYGADHPDRLFYRAATRLSNTEQQIAGNPASIFLNNVKNVLLMFNYTKDEVWVANLPDRPAMDDILGALLVIGAAGAIALSVTQRKPWPIVVLAAGALMLLPSALSIAFPRENPSVVRTGGALPMLMIVCAIVPGNLLTHQHFEKASILRPAFVWLVVTLVSGFVIAINIQRVFVDYPAQYCPRAQNASDIAYEMDSWVSAGHSRANAWIVGYPFWVDTRAVGIWIGDITFPNTAGASVGQQDAASVDLHGQAGWFALNEDDTVSLAHLHHKYPQGKTKIVSGSLCAVKHFVVFTTE